MASCQIKTGWEMPRKRNNKNYCSDQFIPDPLSRILKKMPISFKKLKNTAIARFQAKTGWDRLKKGENKNYHSDQFQSNTLQGIPKKQQKNSKN